jgi:phosphocarrier protein HPr
MAEARVTIINRKGLHARASAKLAGLARQYQSVLIVHNEAMTADARQMMDLMLLIAERGTELKLTAEGPDAEAAVTAAAALINSGFGELGEKDGAY